MTELMRRRRALMAVGGGSPSPVLPDEYQAVEWIESAPKSRSYVLTDVAVKDVQTVEFEGKVGKSGDTLPSVMFYRAADDAARYGFFSNAVWAASAFHCSPGVLNSEEYTGAAVFTKNNGYESETAPLYLFTGPTYGCRNLRCTKFTINNGSAFWGVPVYRKSDNALGLYDYVSRAFYPAVGTFTKGADVT